MYLAPINYDRFFERVFRDLKISKQFLEDLLNVTIEEITYLARKNKITDDSAFIEFDFRCKINGQYVIIDMQQFYKQDVIKRFFLYFCNNTTLQLENIPPIAIPAPNGKVYKTKNYHFLEPSIVLVWMVDDVLGYEEDMAAFSIFPEILNDFIRNEALWATNNLPELLKERTAVNKTKGLDFLPKNRLIYLFQPNIVKNEAKMALYHKWFEFAALTQNPNNQESDFESFKKIPIFNDIMEKLRTTTLSHDDFQYLTDQVEYDKLVGAYDEKIRKEGYEGGWEDALRKYEPMLLMLRQAEIDKKRAEQEKKRIEQEKQQAEQEKQQVEQEKQQVEQEKQQVEQEKQQVEQELLSKQLKMIKKCLKRGDSHEEITDFLEIDMLTLQRFLELIEKEETKKES